MLKKFFAITLIISFSVFGLCEKLTTEQWKEDIDLLYTMFADFHPLLIENENIKKVFKEKIDYLKDNLDKYEEYEKVLVISDAISLLNDLHSTTLDGPEYTENKILAVYDIIFPVFFKDFSNDYYIIKAIDKYKEFIGAKLLKINGINISKIEEMISPYIPKENGQCLKVLCSEALNIFKIMKFVGIVNEENCIFTIEKKSKIYNLNIMTVKYTKDIKFYTSEKQPFYYYNKNINRYYSWKKIEKNKAVYLQLNSMTTSNPLISQKIIQSSNKIPDFDKMTEDILAFMKKNKGYKLIIDIRNNGGGSGRLWDSFLYKVSGINELNKKNKLFIITGKNTASNSIIFLYEFRYNTKANIIGEIPMQSPNFYSGTFSELPNSKILYMRGIRKIKYADDGVNEFIPDIQISEKAEDFFNGRDTILDYIFKNY